MHTTPTDPHWMQHALTLAWHGQYSTTPNPRVGCVLVREGKLIGQGFHAQAGQPHAEVEALRNAQAQGHALAGCTAYVSLEPCAHQGRTGPCTQALVQAQVAQVVMATLDPNPLVAGRGLAALQAAGIGTTVGVLEAEARWLNRGFFSRMQRQRPWVRLKVASSADGITALPNGNSQWITGPTARADTHHLRAQACAVLTGIGTVLHDNPQLNVRHVASPRQPLCIVLDSHMRMPAHSALLHNPQVLWVHAGATPPTWLASHPNAANIHLLDLGQSTQAGIAPHVLLQQLAARGINELHIEAGQRLNGAWLQSGLVDEVVHYQAPMFLGPGMGLASLPALTELPQQQGIEPTWALHSHAAVGTDLKVVWAHAASLAWLQGQTGVNCWPC